jgi:prenyltransferase beta subunit
MADRSRSEVGICWARKITDELAEAWSVRLDRVLRLLRERMKEKDGLIGWTQFLTGDNVGVLSTAQGILTFLEAGAADQSLQRNIDTLRRLQNSDGGWPVRRALIGHSERSITESTVYSLWALTRSGVDLQDPEVLQGIEWLERAQLRDGGWGSIADAPRARIYPTAFTCHYLAEATGNSAAVRQGINWLTEAQNSDGGWGPLKDDQSTRSLNSTALHTAHAVLALLAAGLDPADTHIDGGIRYLRTSLRSSYAEPWPSTSEVETIDDDAALDFRHFTTPWVICALLKAGAPIGDQVVTAGIQWLLAEQHTLGYWTSELTPGQTPIWATFDALHALASVRESALRRISDLFDADAKTVELDFAWRSYFSANDAVVSYAGRQHYGRLRLIYAWNAVITFAVALILLYQGPFSSSVSVVGKIVGSALLGLVPGFGPFVYQVIADRISKWRQKTA